MTVVKMIFSCVKAVVIIRKILIIGRMPIKLLKKIMLPINKLKLQNNSESTCISEEVVDYILRNLIKIKENIISFTPLIMKC